MTRSHPVVCECCVRLATMEPVEAKRTVEIATLRADLASARERVAELEEALREFRKWADGFERPVTGMGAGLHAEMWPSLNPSARRRMLELTRALLDAKAVDRG